MARTSGQARKGAVATVKGPRFTKTCPAYLRLSAKMQSGELDRNTQPQAAWKSDPLYQEYSLKSFRTQYNNLKSNLGLHVRRKFQSVFEFYML